MKKVIFVLEALSGGGAERVALTILKKINLEEFDVTLYIKNEKSLKNIKLDSKIKIFNIKSYKNRYFNFFCDFVSLFKILKENKKSIYFSQLLLGEKLIVIKKFFFPKTKSKFIFRETNIKSRIEKTIAKDRKVLDDLFYKYFINHYDFYIAQSEDMKIEMEKYCEKEKIVLINNPVDVDEIINNSGEIYELKEEGLKLVTIGRLNYQKGYDMLIKTLSKLKEINFKLYILGIGEEKENLIKLIQKVDLTSKIELMGYLENPYKVLKNADYYISSSRFEGFPNVVLEANALGIPVIANDYSGGINEIIIKDLNGEIIDIKNVDRLRVCLEKRYDSNQIKESIVRRYGASVIVKKYEKLFEEIL